VLLQERVLCEVCSVATGGENDGAVETCLLALEVVCHTRHVVAVHVDLVNLGLLDERHALRLLLCQLFETLHQRVCDGHAGELCIVTAVCSWVGVATGI
jgi:hypothetical protein